MRGAGAWGRGPPLAAFAAGRHYNPCAAWGASGAAPERDLASEAGKGLELKPLLGLGGVLLAALTAEFNDGVTSTALIDVRGGLGISQDPGTWLSSLFATGQVVGMSMATFWAVTVSIRRWLLFVIALTCASTVCIPFTSNLGLLYGLRFVQGLSSGFTIPLLLTVALQVLPPPVRLYGLSAYALTATFGPNISTALAALWTELVGWQFVFFEDLPLCALSGLLVWYGVAQQPPRLERIRQFDWRGALLVVIGFGAFTTMLEQGDRLDWFNSKFICVLALVSAVALPLLVLNDLTAELPLYRFSLLKRRNYLFALITLFTFLLLSQSASTIPLRYLQQVAGFRPEQTYVVTVLIAAPQFLLLPAIAFLLDFKSVDARWVLFSGIACVAAACIGNSFLTSVWDAGTFLLWQGFQAAGAPLIVMPLLMMAVNTIKDPADGPFASTLVNTMRGLAEPVGVWMVELIMRWRGALHYNRIVDQSGQGSFNVLQRHDAGSIAAFRSAVQAQATVLTLSDAFLVIACLAVVLMLVLATLPVRTYPPRIVAEQG